jgi:hypothetical protein
MPEFGTRARLLTLPAIRPALRLPRLAAEAQAFVLMTGTGHQVHSATDSMATAPLQPSRFI